MATLYTTTCQTCGRVFTHRHEKLALRGLTLHSCDKTKARAASRERRLAREAAVDKTPKPCHHKQAQHQHGTHACYVLDACRCHPCTTASTTYERRRARSHAYGRFALKWVDAGPVREHVLALGRQGLGLKKVVALSGYSQGAMTKLVYGSEGRPPTRRIRAEHAKAILAVRATLDTLAGGARFDGTGTRRRLQALMAIGWSQSKLAHAMGYELRNFAHLVNATGNVTATTARAVRALYDDLWDQQPPQTTRGDKGAYTRSRRYAAARGWPPPMAWSDDEIDDPAAVPDTGTTHRPGGRVVHIEDIEWLLQHDPLMTAQYLAHRLGVTTGAVQTAIHRAGRRDLTDRLVRNADLARPGRSGRKDTAA